jgi:hypothetical protein
MIHDIKKVYENTIIKEKGENKKEQKEYICRIYKYLVTPKSFGVKENTYICYFEEIANNPENNKNRNESGKEKDSENKKKIGIMIDPGSNDEEIYEFLKEENIEIKYIFLTHNHPDHIAGLDNAKEKLNVPIVISRLDGENIHDKRYTMMRLFRLKELECDVDIMVEHLDEIKICDDIIFKFHLTPGHSLGSMCIELMDTDIVFVGDTVFKEGYRKNRLFRWK